ncbi:MAG TPA: hypothetical protein VN877_05490 [Opitutaceae bacterium]|nr:hypothetical protein [Opitutaceae bacterium]
MGSSEESDSSPTPSVPGTVGAAPRLAAARDRLDAGDLPGALAIYDEVLAVGGDRADVLVTISGDLGSTGHIPQIIDLVAPRYDARRHGPATGLNLVQAFLAVRDADAAQHVLDILFSLNRPELEERLHGFSNAIAELMSQGAVAGIPGAESVERPPEETGLALVTLSKPVWAYGLEEFEEILPRKEGKMRRVAFTQLSLPGAYADVEAAMRRPEDELGRLSRAIPLWFAETFHFSPIYSSIAALACISDSGGIKRPAILPMDWNVENLKKLVESTAGGLDYIFIGSLKREAAETVLVLRVVEVRKLRERKQFTVRWTAATADAELARLHEAVRAYMEWSPYPEGSGLPYSTQSSPTAWLDALGALLGMFLIEKKLLPRDQLPALSPTFDLFATHAFSPPASSLAWISLRARASALGLEPVLSEVLLSRHPAVVRARKLIGS